MSESGITPVTEWPEWSTNPDGGDPLTQDLNAPYDKGDLAWMLVCTILCWQITPAIGFLYAGMHRRKAALTMVLQSLFCSCACGIQYWIYGYSLYMSRTTNPILGDLSLAVFKNVLAQPSQANTDIPDILYAAFGFTFVSATAMILAGAMLERGRLFPSMVFLLCWTTFVYYFLAYWEWNPSGWLYNLGLYDFAGSGPVHIASGFGALAWSMMLGPRLKEDGTAPTSSDRKSKLAHYKPHSPLLMCIGTCFIWFGWFAFNGASTANLSLRSIYVVVNTNLAACGGGVAWVCLDYIYKKKFSLVGFCSGIIAGLVGITPAAGYVPVYVACLVGVITTICSFYVVKYKYLLSVDDGLDIFALHGVGGVVGDILTGFFAANFVPALDGVSGSSYEGGWLNRNFRQMGLQLAGALTCAAWSFFVSCLLLFIINKIPGLHIRASEEHEVRGLDLMYLEEVDFEDGLGNGCMISEGVSRSSPSPPTKVQAATGQSEKKD
ncbi:putative ammonium transporter [Podospora australis]|uniref:Ammonium transporter n=1 Tax=Podospora australis TaxID=1536484 RepID=A0AAN6WMB5_9PEZI|nr:putative ammonium transporter [Podospora australis]